jgi:acetylornithine deacetylase/succinyl-diaminopimelate desuccinylase-like protein
MMNLYSHSLMLKLVLTLGLLVAHVAPAQQPSGTDVNSQVSDYIGQHKAQILSNFKDFLSIPNVASDTANIGLNAEALVQMLEQRGLKAQLLEYQGAPPAVLAEMPPQPGRRTVTFYAHYDGQPVQRADWKQDPWHPIESAGRIYARSASDDKAAIVGLLTAFDALQAAHAHPSVNLRFFFEGEEEAGSPHLEQILSRYADRLRSDLWVICDGPVYQNGQPLVVFGSRGVVVAQITAFGPNRPLHSGHYGNWAPNPIAELANLLARMRTREGEITIPGFYTSVRPLSATEKNALKALPDLDQQLKREFAMGRSEGHDPLPEQIMRPAMNLDRIEGGGTGPNPANAIPSSATAYIDFRMVPDQTPQIVERQVEDYLRQLGYFLVRNPPTADERMQHPHLLQLTWGAGYPPQRTAMDAPVSQAFMAAARSATGDALLAMPTLGGSTPSFLFEKQFRAPVILLPIANFDNNQHAANENIKLENLWQGIRIYAAIFSELGRQWR